MWSDIAKKSADIAAPKSVKTIKKAVNKAVEEKMRCYNFISYEGDEVQNKDLPTLAEQIDAHPKPEVLTVSQIRVKKSNVDDERPRPTKDILASSEVVKFVLSKAAKLKQSDDECYYRSDTASDQSREQKGAHRKLVSQLQQIIKNDPDKRYDIKDGQIKLMILIKNNLPVRLHLQYESNYSVV